MRIIARIPDVAAPVEAAPSVAAQRPREQRRTRVRCGDVRTTWPVATLAVIAVVAWVLASWNDHMRLQRQRDAMRMAREPAPASGGTIDGGSAAGAMVR